MGKGSTPDYQAIRQRAYDLHESRHDDADIVWLSNLVQVYATEHQDAIARRKAEAAALQPNGDPPVKP